ncbi:MAG: hypothetical protein QNK37_14640 [Acidobacteriota bacterium]|nr:hypothetical protein [Acidobacteriota bacterium]
MLPGPVVLLLSLVFVTGDLRPTGDITRDFNHLEDMLATSIENSGDQNEAAAQNLEQALARLLETVAETVLAEVETGNAPGLEMKVIGERLFGEEPVLPAEDKRDGRWYFKPILFEGRAEYLYIFGLKMAGDHTIRLKQVTLFFHDAPPLIHDQWFQMQDGNGYSWPETEFTPWLPAWSDGKPPRARRFKAMEILGTAQDGDREATLTLIFQVPDPNQRPFLDALARLEALRESWRELDTKTPGLQQRAVDLRNLAPLLNLTSCFGPPLPRQRP